MFVLTSRAEKSYSPARVFCYYFRMFGKRMFLIVTFLLFGGMVFAACELPTCVGGEFRTARWTFGNHEPLTMYRRVGNRTTGGLEGGARWLSGWAADFDVRAPSRMRELGFNWTHSRFFKGLGWSEERKDFPAVRAFVDNCHSNGVRTLAYIQFATLYHEKFKLEVPDLADWANYSSDGRHVCWHDQYFRWIPCCTSRGFVDYLKRMIRIALEEGKFDGLMMDNVSSQPPCFCARCRKLFREHLATLDDPKDRFGFDSTEGLDAPDCPVRGGEIQDPLVQEWNRWRADRLIDCIRELAACAHEVSPSAVVSGNITDLRRLNAIGEFCLDVPKLASVFDLIVGQNGNVPACEGGMIVNRIRDLKLAEAIGKPILSLCDGDAGIAREDERFYLLPILEDAIWGGIVTDRTVLTPASGRDFFDEKLIAARKPILKAVNRFLEEERTMFEATSYAPVALLYPCDEIDVSETNWRGIMSAEEVLLRCHVPYRLLLSRGCEGFSVPEDVEVILVCDQKCLSDQEIDRLTKWAARGGRLVVTGCSGSHDERNRQRVESPLPDLARIGRNVRFRAEADRCAIHSTAWKYLVDAPQDAGRRLCQDLAAVGFRPEVTVVSAPCSVMTEMKRTPEGFAVHLLNYDPERPVPAVKLSTGHQGRITFREPFKSGDTVVLHPDSEGCVSLQAFDVYGVLQVSKNQQESENREGVQ